MVERGALAAADVDGLPGDRRGFGLKLRIGLRRCGARRRTRTREALEAAVV